MDTEEKDYIVQLRDWTKDFSTIGNDFWGDIASPQKRQEIAMGILTRLIPIVFGYLRESIENDDTDISWNNPEIEIEYRYKVHDIKNKKTTRVTYDSSSGISPVMQDKSNQYAIIMDLLYGLAGTRCIVVYIGDNGILLTNKADDIQRLPQKKQREIKKSLVNPEPIKITFESPKSITDIISKRKRKYTGTAYFQLLPPRVDYIKDDKMAISRVFIRAGLSFKGISRSRWSEKDKKSFWKLLDNKLKNITTQEAFDFMKKEESDLYKMLNPEAINPITSSENDFPVMSGLHVEDQKFGKKPKPKELPLIDRIEKEAPKLKDEVEKNKIEAYGIDLSVAQGHALFAIQKLLTETYYRGNEQETYLDGNDNQLRYKGIVPTLRFAPSDFYAAFGLTKEETSRGKKENREKKTTEAKNCLRALANTKFLMVYDRVIYDESGKKTRETVRTIRELIHLSEIYVDIDGHERKVLVAGQDSPATVGKLKYFEVQPNPIFVDQFNSYFVLKPADYRQEIKAKAPNASRYVYTFIDYLMNQVAKRDSAAKGKGNKNWIIAYDMRAWAYILKMNAWIERKQWKQIRGSLNKCLDIAQAVGWITGHEIGEGKTVDELITVYLNPDKFIRANKLEREWTEIGELVQTVSIKGQIPVLENT